MATDSISKVRDRVLAGLETTALELRELFDRLAPLEALFGGGTRGTYAKRVNGERGTSLQERVKAHFRSQREHIDVDVPAPNPDYLTIGEAAPLLNMTEAGVRSWVQNGRLRGLKELRMVTFGRNKAPSPRHVIVVHRGDVESLARAGNAGRRSARAIRETTPSPGGTSQVARRRQITLDYLAKYDRHMPRLVPGDGLGPLVRRGYLKRKGSGYVRTSKRFTVKLATRSRSKNAARSSTKPDYKDRVAATRQATAALLMKFDTAEPRPSSLAEKPNSLGVLVSRGYLRKTNDGYLRTAKEFRP
jgi:hypothetical protein